MAGNYLVRISSHDDSEEDTKQYEQHNEIFESHLASTDSEYDFDRDQNIQKASDFIQELIEAKKESKDQTDRFRSRVFYYSKYKYKNTRQFSIASGIPYNVCWEAVDKFKQLIKTNINDLRPDSGF